MQKRATTVLFIFFLFIFSSTYTQEPDILLMSGNAKDELGDYKGAIKDYSEAITLKPNFAMAYFNRALTKRKINDFEGAISDYTQAILYVENYAVAYHNRGIVYALIDKIDNACSDWYKAFELGYNDSMKPIEEFCFETKNK